MIKNKKTFLQNAVLILIVISSIEILCFLSYKIFFHKSPYGVKAELAQQIDATPINDQSINGAISRRILHPYLGYVHLNTDKPRNLETKKDFQNCHYNEMGLLGDRLLLKNSNKSVNILIAGGSVSNQYYCFEKNNLIKTLSNNPYFKNKEINIIGLAVGAWKQPQQLMALSYYLAQGGEYNILINIDGYNEAENFNTVTTRQNSHHTYPLHWKKLINSYNDKELKIIEKIKVKRKSQANLINLPQPLYSSSLINFILDLYFKKLSKDIGKLNVKIQNTNFDTTRSFYRNGPKQKETASIKEATKLWFNSSKLLGQISKANNAKYFHFLQPNQYVLNGKKFTKKELRSFVTNPNSLIPAFYKAFREESIGFKNSHVRFKDLSYIFKNINSDLYVDSCCHFNRLGNDLMNKIIAEEILKHY